MALATLQGKKQGDRKGNRGNSIGRARQRTVCIPFVFDEDKIATDEHGFSRIRGEISGPREPGGDPDWTSAVTSAFASDISAGSYGSVHIAHRNVGPCERLVGATGTGHPGAGPVRRPGDQN